MVYYSITVPNIEMNSICYDVLKLVNEKRISMNAAITRFETVFFYSGC